MKKFAVSLIGNCLSVLGVTLTESQLESMEHIMAIVCMCIGLLITIVSSVIVPLYRWWKKAKEDGTITKEEIEEAQEIIKNGSESIKDNLKNSKK